MIHSQQRSETLSARSFFGFHKIVSPVFLPAGFAMVRTNGFLFAVADQRDADGRDSRVGQILLCACSAPLPQRLVVLDRAAFVTSTP